jgi:hypothetical protein
MIAKVCGNSFTNGVVMKLFRFNSHILNGVLIVFLLVSFFNGTASQAQPLEIQIEKILRKGHPRLMFTKANQRRIEGLAKQDTLLQKLMETLFEQANQLLAEPTITYKLVGPRPRLLVQSQVCLTKILTLSTAYRLSGDLKYAKRAIEEMHTAMEFPDWNPSHFLDVGEMSTALAIGYDWLFDILSPEDKKSIKTALVKYALEPGLSVHPDRFRNKYNNWNLVCNGGLIMTALAIGDEEPVLAEKIIRKGFNSLPNALQSYAPDGAWFEGPVYWVYGTSYLSMLLSSLKSALGDDYGISEYSGLANTGRFFMDTIGPSGDFFNFADGGIRPPDSAPPLLLLAQLYQQPLLAWYNHQILNSWLHILKEPGLRKNRYSYHRRLFALEIIWYIPSHFPEEADLPLDTFYRGLTDVSFFRSSWENEALWVGIKAGKNSVNHAHLDCGSFVFETQGHRWAEDLGSDNYNLPGYFDRKSDGGRRWHYFRTSSLSHNIPTINGQNQKFNSNTKIIAFHSNPGRAHTVVDLSTAYEGQAKSVQRGLAVLNREALLIQDEVVGLKQDDQLRWAMLTSAKVTLLGSRAELHKDDKSIIAEIVQPMNAIFDTVSTKPTYHPEENQNAGTRLLTVSLSLKKDISNTIAILLKPKDKIPSSQTHMIISLSKWKGYFPEVDK